MSGKRRRPHVFPTVQSSAVRKKKGGGLLHKPLRGFRRKKAPKADDRLPTEYDKVVYWYITPPPGRFSILDISTAVVGLNNCSAGAKRSGLETSRRELSEDGSFGIGTLLGCRATELGTPSPGVCGVHRRIRYQMHHNHQPHEAARAAGVRGNNTGCIGGIGLLVLMAIFRSQKFSGRRGPSPQERTTRTYVPDRFFLYFITTGFVVVHTRCLQRGQRVFTKIGWLFW